MRKRYILLKDSPEYKKGAIFEEECDDGTQDFYCINHQDFVASDVYKDLSGWRYKRNIITEQPRWFEELTWFNIRKSQMKQVEEFLGKLTKKKKR